jgi:Flp pilus assembly protein TadD
MKASLIPAIVLMGASIGLGVGAWPAVAAEADKDVAALADTRDLYMTLIRQARADGRARAAIAYLDDFDRHHPGDRESQLLRINCLLDLGQVDAAAAALARIPASDRGGATLAVRGHVLAARGQWPQAAVQYAAALQANPTDAMIANALGYAWLRAGQTAQAVETLRSAHDLAPGDVVPRNNLILALMMNGRVGEAEALLSTVADAKEKSGLRQQVVKEAARLATAAGGLGALGS